jgi:hypothetical protein
MKLHLGDGQRKSRMLTALGLTVSGVLGAYEQEDSESEIESDSDSDSDDDDSTSEYYHSKGGKYALLHEILEHQRAERERAQEQSEEE